MRRYGSLGLSKPHLEPIIGVILSQFNQSKRDRGVERGAGRGCKRWSNELAHMRVSWKQLSLCFVDFSCCPNLHLQGRGPSCAWGFSLIIGFDWNRWVVLAQVWERKPQKVFKAASHEGDDVRDAEPPQTLDRHRAIQGTQRALPTLSLQIGWTTKGPGAVRVGCLETEPSHYTALSAYLLLSYSFLFFSVGYPAF